MRSIVFYLLVLVGIGLIFYLSWLPSPKLSLAWFIPAKLADWADATENDTIRTAVPFIFLGISIGIWLGRHNYPWYWWLVSWFGLVSIALIAETGQLLLPRRNFDWWDIIWGAVGGSVGMSIAILGRHLRTFFIII